MSDLTISPQGTIIGGPVIGGTTGSVLFVGASSILQQDNANIFWDDTNNRLGIGTAVPSAQLTIAAATGFAAPLSGSSIHIIGTDATPLRIQLETNTTTNASGTLIQGRRSRNTAASPSAVLLDDTLLSINSDGYGTTAYHAASVTSFTMRAAEAFTDTAAGTYFTFFTTPTGSITAAEALRIGADKVTTFSGNAQLSGNTVIGNTTSGGNLTLNSTTNPTKGKILLDDEVSLWPSFPTAAAATGFLFSPSTIAINNYENKLFDLSPTITFAGNVPIWTTFASTMTISVDTSVSFQFYTFAQKGTFTSTQKPVFYTFNLFYSNLTFTTATAAKPPVIPQVFMSNNTVQVTANAAGTAGGDLNSYSSTETVQVTASTATMTLPNFNAFRFTPVIKSTVASGALTITAMRAVNAQAPAYTTTGNVTVTSSIGLDFENQSQTSGNLTVGTIAALRSAQNVSSGGTAAWVILATGTAASAHTGPIRIGDTTAPTAAIDISGAQANHIRMAGSTSAPASPTAGDIYYDTTQKTHKFVTTIGTEGNAGLISANTADSSAISNTNAETNFSLNFSCPANSLTVGKVIRIKASGIYTSILTPTLNFKMKYGTTTILDFGAISAGTAVTNRAFELEVMFVVRTIGSTGTIMATGNAFLDNAASVVVTGTATAANNAGTTTIDTTGANNLQVSATWSAASLTNSTTLENFIVEALG